MQRGCNKLICACARIVIFLSWWDVFDVNIVVPIGNPTRIRFH